MCGIAGFAGTRPVAGEVRARMLESLRHRGPDAQRVTGWHAGRLVVDAAAERDDARIAADSALIHARLSIIDPRPEADQPMRNGAGDLWLCYNGEVYGWQRDAAELAARGGPFRTRSDTELVLRGYEAWGLEGLLPRLRGMFAFAILDLRARRLLLARDRLGLKPMIWAQRDGGLAFGSTVRSVLPWLPEGERRLNPDAIDAYLAHRYVPAPMTIVQGVHRLPNAHWLSFDLASGRIETGCYWEARGGGLGRRADLGAGPPPAGDAAASAVSTPAGRGAPATPAEALAELDEAVRLRTVADRPVGVFLSGGIDSTAVACRLAAQGRTDLRTFTAGFADARFDESAEAAATAAALGAPNLRLPVPSAIADAFERIVADLDEPFADPSVFPTWFLARATREHVVVVLGGDGGDELFAGYKRYAKHLRTGWRRGLVLPLPAPVGGASRGAGRLADELRLSWEDAYVLRFSGFSPAERRWLQGGRPLARATWWRTPDGPLPTDPLERLLAIDFANFLPEYVLRKGDLCTMAHGLELRAPLLDHRFVERVHALSRTMRFTDPPKRVLAPAMQAVAALDPFGRPKRGFNPPLGAWLRDDLASRRDGLGTRLASATGGQLDAGAVDALAARHAAGQDALAERLLQLLILDESLAQLRGLGVVP